MKPDVEVTYCFGTDLANARVDPANFDQLVLNLVTNARDAMAHEGGPLTIATNSAKCSSGTAVTLDVGRDDGALDVEVPVGLAPGDYVVMSVLDTGAGMTDEIRVRLFEPFFTTKERGRGTGIGLSRKTVATWFSWRKMAMSLGRSAIAMKVRFTF